MRVLNFFGAYMGCNNDEGIIQKGYFIIGDPDEKSIYKFFGSMEIEIREVKPFSEITKIL
jgi:hypothetical protein